MVFFLNFLFYLEQKLRHTIPEYGMVSSWKATEINVNMWLNTLVHRDLYRRTQIWSQNSAHERWYKWKNYLKIIANIGYKSVVQTIKPNTITILKSLEERLSLSNHNTRRVAIYTDRKVTSPFLTNNFIHSPLVEDIRNKVRQLMTQNLSIHFRWVKAHNGIEGNVLAAPKKQSYMTVN